MTYFMKIYFCLIFYSLTIAFPQINFHLTDHFNPDETDIVFEHDCLRIGNPNRIQGDSQEILSLCLTESLSKWNNNQTNPLVQKFTFNDLRQKNITSEQLYQWSAPIDLIEQYEEYLLSNQFSLANKTFTNCTLPTFGPQCQYEFVYMPSENITLKEIIFQYYFVRYKPRSLTCYVHLKCDLAFESTCVDWADICDGRIDCLNNAIDEKDCWKVQINECKEDEYRCQNGQCISKDFYLDRQSEYECLDRSDDTKYNLILNHPEQYLPTVYFVDRICANRYQWDISAGTSSCDSSRISLSLELILNVKPNILSNICHSTFLCLFYSEKFYSPLCKDICNPGKCVSIIDETCPQIIFTSSKPLAFGHIYIGYHRQQDEYSPRTFPNYICYDDRFCTNLRYNTTKTIYTNNRTCHQIDDSSQLFSDDGLSISTVNAHFSSIYANLQHCNSILYEDFNICNSRFFYRCQNSSKCIPINQLCNSFIDCKYGDDENCRLLNGNCSPIQTDILFKCPLSKKCISLSQVRDGWCDCPVDQTLISSTKYQLCEDEILDPWNSDDLQENNNYFAKSNYKLTFSTFETICDGYDDLLPIVIDGTNHTDETECQNWKCNNIYTHCDGYSNCFDGSDEIGCDRYPIKNCPTNSHMCLIRQTHELICLPFEKINDGHIDCLFSTDESDMCLMSRNHTENQWKFICESFNSQCQNTSMICSFINISNCINQNVTMYCEMLNELNQPYYCADTYALRTLEYRCSHLTDSDRNKFIYFTLEPTEKNYIAKFPEEILIPEKTFQYDFQCHLGYALRLSSDRNQLVCLCSTSYYGNYCQYQNQRVSFTLKFQPYSDSRRTVFSIVILLIENSTQRTIHSSKQITFTYINHCQTKFHFQLIYSTRPKQSNKTYYVHMDFYEKLTLTYRGSLYIPLDFPFLPVHRISRVLTIPRDNQSSIIKCAQNQACIHGQCMKYAENSKNLTFCHCKSGWTGKDCSIPYRCTCSSDSLCAGIEANNRSICICPRHKWGPRCFLMNTICQSSCLNNGQCILTDENMISEKTFVCVCPKGFSGDRCEIEDSKMIISFDSNLTRSDFMLVHFIEVRKDGPIRNGSTFQSIPFYQQEIIIQWSRRFHIVFVELTNKTYYLINVDKNYNQSNVIRKLITSSDRCEYFSQYVNETIVNYPLIRRMKYYHLPCQQSISCFYDQDHFCLCQNVSSERVANCFRFNSTLVHNCFQLNSCQNNGQCVQDAVQCPRTFRCICQQCFYGTLCQFRSSLFDLSLDGIIGSHIQPNSSLSHQSSIIKITLALIVIIVLLGFINGILSLLTFQSKETRQVGCEYYLFGSTITTLLTSVMLTLKFFILLVAQINVDTNRLFLNMQCYSLDYLLQICLNMDKWLNACVAIERAWNIFKGTNFNKMKSKKLAKYVISCLILTMFISTIHDPIYRQLVDDHSNDEQKQVWCIVSYSPPILHFNKFIHTFRFIVPLLINIISVVIIIILATKRRRIVKKNESYYEIFCEQVQQHRHLLISPILIVFVSSPRLIISFIATCVKSNSSPWIYLIGYLASFIPTMLTFFIFVLPSKLYKEEFQKIIKRYRQTIRKRTSCICFFRH